MHGALLVALLMLLNGLAWPLHVSCTVCSVQKAAACHYTITAGDLAPAC